MGGAVLECPVQIHFQNSGFIALFDFPIWSLRKCRIGLSDADDDVSRQSLSIGQLGQPVPTQIAAQKSNSIWWLHKSDTGTLLHRPATLYKSLLSWHPIILITYVCYVYTEVAGHCVLTETVPSCCDKYERNWHFLKAKLKRKNWDINILFLRDEYRWLYGWLLQTQNCLLVCIFRRQHQSINHYILFWSATSLSSWPPLRSTHHDHDHHDHYWDVLTVQGGRRPLRPFLLSPAAPTPSSLQSSLKALRSWWWWGFCWNIK